MNRFAWVVGIVLGGMVVLSGAMAQGVKQTVGLEKVDPATVASGWRASKMIGSEVYNDTNADIGKLDDILVSDDGSIPYAVLSVGGFIGVGTRLVVVPYKSFQLKDDKIVLPGASKDSIGALPSFKYAGK